MTNDKTKPTLTILGAAIILLTVVTVTYAFFASGVDNSKRQEAELTAGTMRLTFADNDSGINQTLNFGDSVTKKLSIRNTGTLPVTAQINWKDLVNTYSTRSLTYTLEYSTSSTGSYTKLITDKKVPVSTSPDKWKLADKIEIPAGTTYYYNLILTLNSLSDID